MRARLPVPVPSSSLLRFLQFQSEGRCFFSANSQGFALDHGSLPGPQAHTAQRLGTPKTSASHLWAAIPTPATCEAGLLNLDFLLPRVALPPSIRPSLNSPRPLAKITRRGAKHSIGGHRCASESHSADWLRRVFGRKVNRRRPLKGVDAPYGDEGAEATAYALGRTMSAKAANEQKLRCTEFDENGNVVLVNGEFKKSELIAKYGLLPRDLRKIDSSLLPHILVRPSAILINLLHLRCLIKANRVLVFDTYGSTDSYTQSVFMYDLEGKLRQKQNSPSAGGLPYEFRALEAVLISVTSGLEGEFETVRGPVVRVLRELEEDIDRDKLRHLLIYSKKLGTFEQKAKLVRDAIDELLEADDDLASMYLTEKTHDLLRGEDDHTEVEMLLESYHKVCDEIVQASGNLVSNIRNTEEIVKAILDANRNALMLLDLKFSIGTLGIGSGAFIAALYGMNLKNFIEESNFGFLGISGFSAIFAAVVCGYGLTKLRKVQRVSMWGEAGKRGARGSWRSIDEETGAGLLERSRRARLLKEDKGGSLREVVGNVKPLPPTVISKTTQV
ncbi:magnesium ion transporter [Pseudogymnoascus australis]